MSQDAIVSDSSAPDGSQNKIFHYLTEEKCRAWAHRKINLGQLIGLQADEAYGIAQMAYNLAENGQLDQAEALVDGLVAMVPEDPYFHGLLASILIQQERFDEALAAFDQALERQPEDLHARVNRGELYMRRGDFVAALADLEIAIGLDPERDEPMADRARMLIVVAKAIFDRVVATRTEGAAQADA